MEKRHLGSLGRDSEESPCAAEQPFAPPAPIACDSKEDHACPSAVVSPRPPVSASSLFLRRFCLADEPEIDDIGELCYPPDIEDPVAFRAKLYVGDSFVAVDKATGAIAAYAIGVPWHTQPMHINEAPTEEATKGADVYVVHDVAVHPNWRGCGVAGVLLEQLFDCARAREIKKAVLVAISPTARAVWSKKGFIPMVCNSDSGYGSTATKMECFVN